MQRDRIWELVGGSALGVVGILIGLLYSYLNNSLDRLDKKDESLSVTISTIESEIAVIKTTEQEIDKEFTELKGVNKEILKEIQDLREKLILLQKDK